MDETSGVAMGLCRLCNAPGLPVVRGALGSQKSIFLFEGGSRGSPPKICTRAPNNLATLLDEMSIFA